MSSSLTVIHRAQDLVLAELGNTCIALWRAKPSLTTFQVQRAELGRIVARAPGEAALLCVVEAESEPPEEPVRKASSEMITQHGTRLRKVACVIEGKGFRAAITRSVLSGMQLITRSPAEIRFFRALIDGAVWLDSDQYRARAIVRHVDELRALAPSSHNRRAVVGV